jgi:hypothetical protein
MCVAVPREAAKVASRQTAPYRAGMHTGAWALECFCSCQAQGVGIASIAKRKDRLQGYLVCAEERRSSAHSKRNAFARAMLVGASIAPITKTKDCTRCLVCAEERRSGSRDKAEPLRSFTPDVTAPYRAGMHSGAWAWTCFRSRHAHRREHRRNDEKKRQAARLPRVCCANAGTAPDMKREPLKSLRRAHAARTPGRNLMRGHNLLREARGVQLSQRGRIRWQPLRSIGFQPARSAVAIAQFPCTSVAMLLLVPCASAWGIASTASGTPSPAVACALGPGIARSQIEKTAPLPRVALKNAEAAPRANVFCRACARQKVEAAPTRDGNR